MDSLDTAVEDSHNGNVEFAGTDENDENDDENIQSASDSSDDLEDIEQEEHWEVEVEDIVKDFDTRTDDCICGKDTAPIGTTIYHGLLNMIMLFILLWASFYEASAAAVNHLIKFLQHAFTVLAANSPSVTTLRIYSISNFFVYVKKILWFLR